MVATARLVATAQTSSCHIKSPGTFQKAVMGRHMFPQKVLIPVRQCGGPHLMRGLLPKSRNGISIGLSVLQGSPVCPTNRQTDRETSERTDHKTINICSNCRPIRHERLRGLQCSRRQLCLHISLSCITNCCNICHILEELLVSSLELACFTIYKFTSKWSWLQTVCKLSAVD